MSSCRTFAAARAALLAVVAVLAPATAAEARVLRLPDGASLRVSGGGLPGPSGRPVALAPAGDVNGDGLGDVLIGVPSADPLGRRDAGSAYVLFGRRDRTRVDLDRLGASGLRIDGRPPAVPVELDRRGVTGEATGTAVAGLGDVNGDGLADVAVTAPYASRDEGRLVSGAVFVVHGRRSSGAVDLAALGAGGFRIDGPRAFGGFGDTIAGLKGRLPQVAVAASDRVHVVRLNQPAGTVVDLAAPDARASLISGVDQGDFNPFYAEPDRPRRLAAAGDVNGDGLGDLVIGPGNSDVEGVEPDESPYESSAFVVFAGPAADLGRLGSRGIRIDGVDGDTTSFAVGLGDAGGDRRPDVLVAGTTGSRFGRSGSGPARVVFGRVAGRVSVRRDRPGVRRVPARGSSVVAGPGDVDGDGRADVAVASPFASGGGGHVDVVSSRFLGRRAVDPLARLTGRRGDRAGASLVGAGDIDGDGRGDLALSAGREVLVVSSRAMRGR